MESFAFDHTILDYRHISGIIPSHGSRICYTNVKYTLHWFHMKVYVQYHDIQWRWQNEIMLHAWFDVMPSIVSEMGFMTYMAGRYQNWLCQCTDKCMVQWNLSIKTTFRYINTSLDTADHSVTVSRKLQILETTIPIVTKAVLLYLIFQAPSWKRVSTLLASI